MDEDIERFRRSLAMAPSLPKDVCQQLLEEIAGLRQVRRDIADELDRLAEQIRALRAGMG